MKSVFGKLRTLLELPHPNYKAMSRFQEWELRADFPRKIARQETRASDSDKVPVFQGSHFDHTN